VVLHAAAAQVLPVCSLHATALKTNELLSYNSAILAEHQLTN
jgi:hypothetical protein